MIMENENVSAKKSLLELSLKDIRKVKGKAI